MTIHLFTFIESLPPEKKGNTNTDTVKKNLYVYKIYKKRYRKKKVQEKHKKSTATKVFHFGYMPRT